MLSLDVEDDNILKEVLLCQDFGTISARVFGYRRTREGNYRCGCLRKLKDRLAAGHCRRRPIRRFGYWVRPRTRKVKGEERSVRVEEKGINIIRMRHVFDLGLHWFTDRAHYWPFWWCVSSRLDHIRERSWLPEVRGMSRT
jgi:hypothetical protein